MWKLIAVLVLAVFLGYIFIDRTDTGEVNNKRVIVTGASKGIGEQLAYNYARLGANVIAIARTEDKLKEVIAECKKVAPEDRTFDYIVADLEDLNSTDRVVKEAIRKLGGLDYLVLNHVGLSPKGMWQGQPEQFSRLHRSFHLNFFSYVYLATHAMTALETSAGSILVVGSVAGKIGTPTTAMYSAEKFALDGFFSAWRLELAMKNSPVSITYCVLGLIGTETGQVAMQNTKGIKENRIHYADPGDTAYDIIRGGVSRARQIYTPWFTHLIILSRDTLTVVYEAMIKDVMSDHTNE